MRLSYKLRTKRRSEVGFSIVELMMSTVVFAVCVAMIGEMAVLSTKGTIKTSNTSDSQVHARNAINRIANDVRIGRGFGDYYGNASERLKFPSNSNPIYNAIRAPIGGWPAAPWPSTINLSDSTLIIQSPVVFLSPTNDPLSPFYFSSAPFDTRNGMPLMLPKGNFGAPNDPLYNMENLDTTVYSVVPDIDRPGEFILQVARFPGAQITNLPPNVCSYKTLINPPQTILKGITGPKAIGDLATDPPRIFSYLRRNRKTVGSAPSTFSVTALDASSIGDVLGVSIDLEFRTTGLSSNTSSTNDMIAALHEEAFLRNNRNMVLNNTTVLP